jgi:hypothetical protein
VKLTDIDYLAMIAKHPNGLYVVYVSTGYRGPRRYDDGGHPYIGPMCETEEECRTAHGVEAEAE